MKIGYARVSTIDQDISSQIHLLQQAGCEKIFTDHATGINENRPGLQEMLSILRKDDILIIYKTDRLFRSLRNMVDLIEKFKELEVVFKSLSEPEFDLTTPNGKFILQIFGAVAEFERNLISERTKIGLEGARRRNKLLGRPKGIKKETIRKYKSAVHFYTSENMSIDNSCQTANISKTTFYRVEAYLKSIVSAKNK